jgi:Protein of unknown function (DUF2934)
MQQAYECAFQEFSDRVRGLQCLTLHPSPDAATIYVALLELEKAHWVYDRCRDALAVELLPASLRGKFHRIEPNSAEAYEDRVRTVARLLWETLGRPEGTADDDWHRAERIVHRATAA